MAKRIVGFLLTLLMLFSAVPLVSLADTTVSYAISAVNGTRYTDYLVIYNRAGSATGTNVYGVEVTVVNGVVTAIGGNNTTVPSGSDSFVVSGHGAAQDWINDNVTVGMKVTYSWNGRSGTVTFVSDSSTAKYAAEIARETAHEAKQAAQDACIFYDSEADDRLAAADEVFASSTTLTQAQSDALVKEYTLITSLYLEREAVQYRGLWLRPTQKSKTEVENYVRQCYLSGINMICIETIYSSTMIFPTPSGSLFNQNPIFNGFDVLGAFVEACHKYGMELHCWTPVFYSGDSGHSNWSLSVAAQKPEWQLKTNNGSSLYAGEGTGMVFLNPALDEVQDCLIELYTYILETYDIDGFQLDYIRYRDRSSTEDYGYDAATIAEFKKEYPKYQSYNITYNTNAYYWNDWVAFRAAQVTEFVGRMRNLVDTIAPDVMLTADVGASLDSAYWSLYQDGATWLENEWLDMIHPMAYGEGYGSYVSEFFKYCDEGCLVVPGLGIFMADFDAQDMVKQTTEMVNIGCAGVIYFESVSFNSKNTGSALSESIFTEHALAPAFNNTETALASINRFKERVDLALECGYLSSSLANDLIWMSNQTITAVNEKVCEADDEIIYLRSLLTSEVSGALRERMELDLGTALAAALRDSGTTDGSSGTNNGIPPEAEGKIQLTLDGINRTLTGEDSSLNTDLFGNYNTRYAYNMLLKPVEGEENVYELIEAVEGTGSTVSFDNLFTEGMVIAAFHTDKVGDGKERVALAKTVPLGSKLVLYGIDVDKNEFTAPVAMLYVSELGDGTPSVEPIPHEHIPGTEATCLSPQICTVCNGILVPAKGHKAGEWTTLEDGSKEQRCSVCDLLLGTKPAPENKGKLGDVNLDGAIDQYDYILVKRHYFGTRFLTSDETARADVNADGYVNQYDYILIKRHYFGTYKIG